MELAGAPRRCLDIKMPLEMSEEVLEGRKEGDKLLDWVKNDAIRKALPFDEASNPDLVRKGR